MAADGMPAKDRGRWTARMEAEGLVAVGLVVSDVTHTDSSFFNKEDQLSVVWLVAREVWWSGQQIVSVAESDVRRMLRTSSKLPVHVAATTIIVSLSMGELDKRA